MPKSAHKKKANNNLKLKDHYNRIFNLRDKQDPEEVSNALVKINHLIFKEFTKLRLIDSDLSYFEMVKLACKLSDSHIVAYIFYEHFKIYEDYFRRDKQYDDVLQKKQDIKSKLQEISFDQEIEFDNRDLKSVYNITKKVLATKYYTSAISIERLYKEVANEVIIPQSIFEHELINAKDSLSSIDALINTIEYLTKLYRDKSYNKKNDPLVTISNKAAISGAIRLKRFVNKVKKLEEILKDIENKEKRDKISKKTYDKLKHIPLKPVNIKKTDRLNLPIDFRALEDLIKETRKLADSTKKEI